MKLDVDFVRQHFPAFNGDTKIDGHFLDAAAGSYPCQQTIDALTGFYLYNKVQPGNPYPESQRAMTQMVSSRERWAQALNVQPHELDFGPSTTQNLYVLASAFRDLLVPGDEVVVTNQDHESNNGAMRRAVKDAGATLVEWQVDTESGLLDPEQLALIVSNKTKLICFPHSSNLAGTRNDVERVVEIAKTIDAFTLCDGVSYAPHEIPDVDLMGVDIYLFSLYKVYSVHQGLLVIRERLLAQLPKQGHFFKSALTVGEKMIPAGPDHAQVAAAGGVLDYIMSLALHHGFEPASSGQEDLAGASRFVSELWHVHERAILAPLLDYLNTRQSVRYLGARTANNDRCPLVTFSAVDRDPAELTKALCERKILCCTSHCYAPRLLEAVGMDAQKGGVRFSMAHFNNADDVSATIAALDELL